MVPVPEAVPLSATPRKPSELPDTGSAMICPLATTLSGLPEGTSGQVNVTPSAVTGPPGVMPTAASAVAEKLLPYPSKFPGAGSESSVMPTLSNAAASDGYGMVTWTAEPGLSRVVPSDATPVTVIGTVSVPGAASDDTATVSDALSPPPAASAAEPEAGVTVIPEPAGGAAAHCRVSEPAAMLLFASVTEPLPPRATSSEPGVTVEEIGDSIATW